MCCAGDTRYANAMRRRIPRIKFGGPLWAMAFVFTWFPWTSNPDQQPVVCVPGWGGWVGGCGCDCVSGDDMSCICASCVALLCMILNVRVEQRGKRGWNATCSARPAAVAVQCRLPSTDLLWSCAVRCFSQEGACNILSVLF